VIIRCLAAAYSAVILALTVGIGFAAIAFASGKYIGLSLLFALVAVIGLAHVVIVIGWARQPVRIVEGEAGIKIQSRTLISSPLQLNWSDIERVEMAPIDNVAPGVASLSPLPVPPSVQFFLREAVYLNPRRLAVLLLDPMGQWPGNSAELPRHGRSYSQVMFWIPSAKVRAELIASLSRNGIAVEA
jgi:hypothetical protein